MDTEAAEMGEEPIGIEARALADEITQAALAGDGEKVRSLCALIAEAEGKPQERVEHSGQTARTLVIRAATSEPVALPEASE